MARMEPRAGNWKKRSQALPNLQCFLGLPSPQIQLTSNNHEQHFKDHNSPIHPFFSFSPSPPPSPSSLLLPHYHFCREMDSMELGGLGCFPIKSQPLTGWVWQVPTLCLVHLCFSRQLWRPTTIVCVKDFTEYMEYGRCPVSSCSLSQPISQALLQPFLFPLSEDLANKWSLPLGLHCGAQLKVHFIWGKAVDKEQV